VDATGGRKIIFGQGTTLRVESSKKCFYIHSNS